jgi:hypothetical protein
VLGTGAYQYPPPASDETQEMGVWPVDFILETIIRAGIEWFQTDPKAPNKVFGHLKDPWLNEKYGQAKIDEIAAFVRKYKIKVVQSFAMIDQEVPSISIQLLDGSEMTDRAGLADFAQVVDVMDANLEIKGRTEVGYSAVSDSIQLGIHAIGTPDLTKYLYYLLVYVLNSFKPEMETRGLQLGTFRGTDISRLNEYLPENIYSRFLNFTVFSIATFDKGAVPIMEKIMGVSFPDASLGDSAVEGTDPSETVSVETGLRLNDIQEEG